MEPDVIAIDIAKQVFQPHWVDSETGSTLVPESCADTTSLTKRSSEH